MLRQGFSSLRLPCHAAREEPFLFLSFSLSSTFYLLQLFVWSKEGERTARGDRGGGGLSASAARNSPIHIRTSLFRLFTCVTIVELFFTLIPFHLWLGGWSLPPPPLRRERESTTNFSRRREPSFPHSEIQKGRDEHKKWPLHPKKTGKKCRISQKAKSDVFPSLSDFNLLILSLTAEAIYQIRLSFPLRSLISFPRTISLSLLPLKRPLFPFDMCTIKAILLRNKHPLV